MEAVDAWEYHAPHRADVPPPHGVNHQRADGLPPRPPGEGPRGVRRADVQGPPPFERGELHSPPRPRCDNVPVNPPRTPEGDTRAEADNRGAGRKVVGSETLYTY